MQLLQSQQPGSRPALEYHASWPRAYLSLYPRVRSEVFGAWPHIPPNR